jgi:O-antigen/teichoic acid export membrane protein
MIIAAIRRSLSNPLLVRFGKNGFIQIYTQFLTLAIQLVQVPLFIKFWGEGLYAEWIVLTGLPSMLLLLDFGVAQASASKATMEAAGGEWHEARISINTSQMFTTTLGVILVVGALLFSRFFSSTDTLGLKLIGDGQSVIILTLSVAYLALNLQGGVIDAVFRTLGKAAIGSMLNANRRLMDLFVTVVCVCLGAGVVELSVSIFIGQVIYLLAIVVIVKRIDRHGLMGYRSASFTEFRGILKPSLAYMGFPLSQMLTTQGAVQMLNLIGAVWLVIPFTMTRTLVRTIIQIAVVISNSLKPELSWLIGSGQKLEAKKFTQKMSLIASSFAMLWYGILVIIGPRVINVWGHGEISVTHMMVLLIGIHALVNVFWFVSAAYKTAGNAHTTLSVVYAASSILGMAAWYVLRNDVEPYICVCLMMLLPELVAWIYGIQSSRRISSETA